MHLTRLSLTDFRNHATMMVAPGSGFVILTGENGAGKTNILEAVSLLVPGRGLRGASLSQIARQGGQGGFAVSAGLDGDVEVGTGTAASAPDRRLVRINGASAPVTALAEWLSAVWLTPSMDRLFTDTAGERRRFLDRLVLALNPAHARHSTRYEAAMRQRNRLLAEERPADPEWLTALEAQMAEHGTEIAGARQELVQSLSLELLRFDHGPFARASLALEAGLESDRFAQALATSRTRDAAAGRVLSGPHRADLLVTHAEKQQAAALCSTGEQKALLLGIVLAHAALVASRTGQAPLLLLDEVAAHLDPRRRAALFERLAQTGSQIWMTGTEAELFTAIQGEASRFSVSPSAVSPA